MIERQGGTRKTTHREAKKEKTRGIAKEREGAMETSQLPERARVSLFPLLPLFVFFLCHLKAHEITDHRPTPTQNYNKQAILSRFKPSRS